MYLNGLLELCKLFFNNIFYIALTLSVLCSWIYSPSYSLSLLIFSLISSFVIFAVKNDNKTTQNLVFFVQF